MSAPSIPSAVARQVKEKNALIGNLNLKITNLEAELEAEKKNNEDLSFCVKTQTSVANNLRSENATLKAQLEATGAELAQCCVSGKWWSVADLENDGWWDDMNDQWYGPDELDSRPDWTEDMEDDWEECYGHKTDGAIWTYEMSGGSANWWKYKVINTGKGTAGENCYLVFVEDSGGWHHKKGATLYLRGDYILLEAEDECHDRGYLDTEDWEWRESMNVGDILDW
jgi:hypothetical protein